MIKKEMFASIGGIISGVVSIIGSIVMFQTSTGAGVIKLSYGGDAYTGMQNASASVADNVHYVALICAKGFGWVLLIIGLTLIFFFLRQMLANLPKKKSNVSSVGTKVNASEAKTSSHENKTVSSKNNSKSAGSIDTVIKPDVETFMESEKPAESK